MYLRAREKATYLWLQHSEKGPVTGNTVRKMAVAGGGKGATQVGSDNEPGVFLSIFY